MTFDEVAQELRQFNESAEAKRQDKWLELLIITQTEGLLWTRNYETGSSS